VRFANIAIIEGNDASRFGIGIVCARIVEALLGAERVVMPVATYGERYGVTIGLPTVVGRNGAAGVLEPSMSEHERRAVDRSAVTLRDAARRIGVRSG
jgi:L-lactate dehydrogenase